VPADAIRSAAYLAADGGTERTREIEYALVTNVTQAAQLAAYEVANSREKIGISLTLGLVWSQYKVGDCMTLNLPRAGLINSKAIVIGRHYDPAENTVVLEFRTEDDAKHDWALDIVASAPPPTTVVRPPGGGDDAASSPTTSQLQQDLRATYPTGLSVSSGDTGTSARVTLSAFTMQYPTGAVAIATHTYTGLAYSTTYYPFCDVDASGDSTPTFGITTVYGDSLNSTAHPKRVDLKRTVTTPVAGGSDTSGGGTGGGYGGGTFGGEIP
jgi:hypothetical protein